MFCNPAAASVTEGGALGGNPKRVGSQREGKTGAKAGDKITNSCVCLATISYQHVVASLTYSSGKPSDPPPLCHETAMEIFFRALTFLAITKTTVKNLVTHLAPPKSFGNMTASTRYQPVESIPVLSTRSITYKSWSEKT